MKILIPLLTLVQLSTANASLVAIMDSGTDISHKDLAPKAWYNAAEKAGSPVDLDNDGLPGDINGWDFIANSPKVFDDKYINLITPDVKTFFNYYSMYELGQLNGSSPELAWLQSHGQDKSFMNITNFIGGYIHGTHVAGISARDNAQVKILSLKIIPTVYKELPKPQPVNPNVPPVPPVAPVDNTPAITVDQLTAEVLDNVGQQITEMVNLNGYVNLHKIDVANQSFGIGYNDAVRFLSNAFNQEIKRAPTQAELDTLLKVYFGELLKQGPKMFAAAPNTLFTIAAGNDSNNNDLKPDYPSTIQADNKIVVAATVGYKALAEFSNYGATKVDVAAPGVAILSTAPTNSYIPLSGTSQAAPYVTNMVAAMKDLNPALGVRDLKAIVLGTVDVKPWLRGKVLTSGIVNKSRALKAAEFAKTMNVDIAITKARATILDVPVEKSRFVKPTGLGINFRPVRPSLLVRQM